MALAALAASCGGGEPEAPRPNVLLISIDTLRPDFLGCYGHERDTSPALDRLAGEGVLFEDVTSASPWTLPSHASMLTGLYPSSHGVKDHDRQLTRETLATRLKRAGYQTMAIVNSHNIGNPRYGLLRGFEDSRYELEMEVDEETSLIVNKGERITKQALRFLRSRDEARPFFLFLHYYDVHTDFTPDPEWTLEFVAPYEGPLTGNTQELVDCRAGQMTLDEADVRWLEEMYEAEIRTLDALLLRIFDYLDASGLADSTVVAVTSDHGEEYWEHGSVLHGRTYYEEVIKIPLILRGPGIPAGLRVAEPVHLVDVAPTLFAATGVASAEELDGIDLSGAWLRPGSLPAERELFAEADHNNVVDGEERSDVRRMVRRGAEKLFYDTVSGERELYDLERDPRELDDLAAQRPESVEALWSSLEAFMANDTGGGARELGPLESTSLEDLNRLGY